MDTPDPSPMDARHAQLTGELQALVEKYRAIFVWDIPGVDEALSERLILQAFRQGLFAIEGASPGHGAA